MIDDGNGNYPSTGISLTNMSNLIYSFSSLTSGKTYRVKIRAINQIGPSNFSDNGLFFIASLPNAPDNIYLTNSSENSISLTWTLPSNNGGSIILGYKLYMYVTGMYTVVYDGSRNSSNMSFTVSNLANGLYYKFKVSALNIIGESSLSSDFSFLCASTPSSPGQPFLISSSKTNIKFGFSYSTSIGGASLLSYEVYWKFVNQNESTWALLTTLGINSLSYDHTGLTIINDYQYKVILK